VKRTQMPGRTRRLAPMSAKRRAKLGNKFNGTTFAAKVKPRSIGPDKATADAVYERDCAACVVCGTFLPPGMRGSVWSIHHRRRVRTDNRLSNLIAVCGGADVPGCHQEIHANVAKAGEAGWLVGHAFEPSQMLMAHSQHGWVLLCDDGDVIGDHS